MRISAILFATFVLAACSTAPPTRSQSQDISPAQRVLAQSQVTSIDTVVRFLITSAATDFHTHGPSHPLRFRDVRVGHIVAPNKEAHYLMCGQFLPLQDGDKVQWTQFATIKTDPYEQWIGGQAAPYCQGSSVVWDKAEDLSSLLQSRFDSLR